MHTPPTHLATRRKNRQLAALVATILWLGTTACATWPEIESSPGAPPSAETLAEADQIRVVTTDGRKIELEHGVRVVGDSLVGWRVAPGRQRPQPEGREAIALDDIETIRQRKGQPALTVLAVAGGVLIVATLACAATSCFDLGGLDFSGGY